MFVKYDQGRLDKPGQGMAGLFFSKNITYLLSEYDVFNMQKCCLLEIKRFFLI